MELIITRQPILNTRQKLFGYELIYQGLKGGGLADIKSDKATTTILSSAFLTRDIDELSSYKPCFINFSQALIEQNLPASFPKTQIIIELDKSVEPTEELIASCRNLNKQGYRLAMDDFSFHRKYHQLLKYISIIKIDVRLTPTNSLVKTLHYLKPYNLRLLADKVESNADFHKAKKQGFSYFKGYFFSRPEDIEITEIASNKVSMLKLLNEVSQKKTTIYKLHDIIATDVAISYKLLKFLNSAYFYRLQEVKTIKHAIAYLGEKELRRFILLVIISELASDHPGELVRLVLVRAKLCELLGLASPHTDKAEQLFITGLFSALDRMLNTPMKKVMDRLPIFPDIQNALVNRQGLLTVFLETAIAFERHKKETIRKNVAFLKIDPSQLKKIYLTAVKYANGVM